MFFPYNTDAPIYYWPIVTVCLIAANAAAFAFQMTNPEAFEPWMLEIGNGLHPVQWLTSVFMHANLAHLVGNMLFLWSFGLVVEGKLGSVKTLAVYLVIGVTESAITQALMLGNEPTHCLGASAAIYGFMAMCLIWAPENCMECVALIYYRVFHFEMKIKIFVGLYVALDVLGVILSGARLSTEFMHSLGALLGFVAGIALLKAEQVDCEYWDIFSVWSGQHLLTEAEREKIEAEKPENKRLEAEQRQKDRERMGQEIHRAIQTKSVLPALKIHQRMLNEYSDWRMPENDLLALIQLLLTKEMKEEAATAMEEYLSCSALSGGYFTKQRYGASALKKLSLT